VASRYAEALFGLAHEREATDAVRQELHELTLVIREAPVLADLLERPDIDADRKLAAVNAAVGDRFSEMVLSLLATLVHHRRGEYVPEVTAAFDEMADAAAGVVRAEATTAVPLSGEQRERLTAVLARFTGKRVLLEERTDPDVLAGVRVRVGDRLIDGSAAGRLQRLREELLGRASTA
jgi:F-type H+-transporting ATPase subunit delta